MGQSSIHYLNKVGYSMFWNSMWDNEITYTRLLKEDVFLNNFFLLALRDGLSANTVNFNKKRLNFCKKYLYLIENKKFFNLKYLINTNKFDFFSAKLWILKYQKWVILYNYIYIPNNNKLFSKNLEYKINYKNNFFYTYKFYLKQNLTLSLNFNLLKKNKQSMIF